MLLGVIFMFCFGILEEIAKRRKTGKSRQNRAPTLQRREPTLRRRRMIGHGIPSPWRARGSKMAPLWYAKA